MDLNERFIKKYTGLKVAAVKHARSTFDEIGDNDAIIALSQDNGVGRGDHTFYSPRGGLYMVMRECGLDIDAQTLTHKVGLAVHDTILTVLGLSVRLKWVNDIFYDGKKVCGILCRSPRRGEYLIGVGVNYSTDIAELKKAGLDNAGSLGAPEARASEFCARLIRRIHVIARKQFDCTRYNVLCDTVGKNISFNQNGVAVTGFAEKVETDGTLLVRIGKATVAVDSGEVSIVREADGENSARAE